VTDGGPWINLSDTEKIPYQPLCIFGTVEIWNIVLTVMKIFQRGEFIGDYHDN